MSPTDRLTALIGTWRTLRVIHHAGGGTARFEGVTRWHPDGVTLRCEERGRLMQGGTIFDARRNTLWHATPDAILVSYADGRPFHAIDGPMAHHDCPPDSYVLRYDWANWPRWTVRWHVTGPRKDYRALTRYRRV